MKRPRTISIRPRREVTIREAAFILQMRVDRVAAIADEIRHPSGDPGVFFIGARRHVAVAALQDYLTNRSADYDEAAALTPTRILDAIARGQIKVPRFKSRNAAPPPFDGLILSTQPDWSERQRANAA